MSLQRFYFTYGTDSYYPFQGGWTLVYANSKEQAIKTFKEYHPNRDGSPFINCAFIYTQDEFEKTEMYENEDNFGKGLMEILNAEPQKDLVEVIRCKDCAHHFCIDNEIPMHLCKRYAEYDGEGFDIFVDEDGYCAWAENK